MEIPSSTAANTPQSAALSRFSNASQGIQKVIVIGDGWAALGCVGFLVTAGIEVVWLAGSGARLLAPTVALNHGPGAQVWWELAKNFQPEFSEPQAGIFVKEYRNHAFRDPAWSKAPSMDARKEVILESLWEPEQRWVGPLEFRFSIPLLDLEEQIRGELLSGRFPHLTRIEGLPVQSLLVENQCVTGVELGSGEKVLATQVIYADRWSLLSGIANVPRPLSFLRKRDPVGALQASFHHEPPLQGGILQSFFAPVHRESGDQLERHFWGYLSGDGKRSVWTLGLSNEEGEDNHEIAKKIRKLKSSLDRIFKGSDIIPSGHESFTSTLVREQFRFEEEALFTQGNPPEAPFEVASLGGILFMTDAYGPAQAMQQVGKALLDPRSTEDTPAVTGVDWNPDLNLEEKPNGKTRREPQLMDLAVT